MNTFHLLLGTSDGTFYDGQAQDLSVRGIAGDLAVRAGHIPFVTIVSPGTVRILTETGEERFAFCGRGVLRVNAEQTTLLSTEFHWQKTPGQKQA